MVWGLINDTVVLCASPIYVSRNLIGVDLSASLSLHSLVLFRLLLLGFVSALTETTPEPVGQEQQIFLY